MAKVRVEWISLGMEQGYGFASGVIVSVLGTPSALTVTGTATLAGSRPVAPAYDPAANFHAHLYARVSCVEGNVICAYGADPTAAQDNGVLVMAGGVEVLPVDAGQKLSFIDLGLMGVSYAYGYGADRRRAHPAPAPGGTGALAFNDADNSGLLVLLEDI